MHRLAIRALLDLLLATETVGDDKRLVILLSYRRKQHALAAGYRHVVMAALLEAEGAGHAAAAILRHVEIEADFLQKVYFVLHAHDGFVVAVPVDERFFLQTRWMIVLDFAVEELA